MGRESVIKFKTSEAGTEGASPVLSKSYDPEVFEQDIYRFWDESGCFRAADESKKDQDPYCIVIPPPNVTGVLHIGHALTNTIQDILIRYYDQQSQFQLIISTNDYGLLVTEQGVEEIKAPITPR